MLTFEDFFAKKRIDLTQLEQAEPALFAEFSKHYRLMGEKSFDHAKKYWFNQLRRTYPIAETVKPHPVSADAITNLSVQSIAAAAAQNLNASIEKPKFKEDELAGLTDHNISEKDISLAEAEQAILQSQQEPETKKPAFKPRFNPKKVSESDDQQKAATNEALQATKNQETDLPKPAFKPRFNMQNIKKDVVKTASDSVGTADEISSGVMGTNSEDASSATVKPDDSDLIVQKTEQEIERKADQQTEIRENKSEKTEPEKTKPAYKPRFQMKNINKPTQPPV